MVVNFDLFLNFCLILGGDGFFLVLIWVGGFDFFYMGLNVGRVGFMLNEVFKDGFEGFVR